MDSALCLHYVPMPSLQAHHIPSTVRSTTRPHFTFSHSSLMLSNASKSHLKRHAFSPIIKHKAPSVRACADDDTPKLEDALKTFLDNINSELASTTVSLPSLPPPEDGVNKPEMWAMQLLKSGKNTEAEELLRKRLQESLKDNKGPEIYGLSMALAEIYIFQGKYKEASDLECLKPLDFPSDDHPSDDHPPVGPSDSRVPRYKAILCIMFNKKKDAEKWWDQYTTEGLPNP